MYTIHMNLISDSVLIIPAKVIFIKSTFYREAVHGLAVRKIRDSNKKKISHFVL